jgi:hypothetical protein
LSTPSIDVKFKLAAEIVDEKEIVTAIEVWTLVLRGALLQDPHTYAPYVPLIERLGNVRNRIQFTNIQPRLALEAALAQDE